MTSDLPRGRVAGMRFPHSRVGAAGQGVPVGEFKPGDDPKSVDSPPSTPDRTRRAPVASVERRKTASQQAQINAWRRKAAQKGST